MRIDLLKKLLARNVLCLVLCFAGICSAWGEEVTVTFDASKQGYSNGQDITNVTITDGITVSFNNSTYYNTGTAIRVYAGGYFTIKSTVGNITQIKFTFGSNDGDNEITKNCGTYYSNSDTWEGSSQSIKFTVGGDKGHRRFKSIAVTYENVDLNSIEITGTPAVTTYYVGDSPSAEGLVVTAKYSNNSTENVTEETEWTFDPSVIETSTTSIIATARYEGMIAEKSFNITRKSIANTKANPYSVAEAYSITDAGKGLGEEVYVIGIVVKVEEISIGHLTYWISDDGTTSKTFKCLQGLGIEAKEFDSNTDFTIGSRVIVKGRLQKVNGTYGFKKNNILKPR